MGPVASSDASWGSVSVSTVLLLYDLVSKMNFGRIGIENRAFKECFPRNSSNTQNLGDEVPKPTGNINI